MGKSIAHLEGVELAKAALMKILPIPKKKFITRYFVSERTKSCCVIGHITRLERNPKEYIISNCNDYSLHPLRKLYLNGERQYNNIVTVNNSKIEGFPQDNPKDRVIAYLRRYIKENS